MSISRSGTAQASLLKLPPYSAASPSRLQALYSDISRQKHSNPTAYHSKIEWWRNVLQVIVSLGLQSDSQSRLVLKAGQGLLERIRVEGTGKPLALGTILNELRANKDLISLNEFLNSKDSIYNSGWLPGRLAAVIVGKPLWWALEQLGVVGEEGIFGGVSSHDRSHNDTAWWGEYVVISLLEKAADEVLAKQEGKLGGVESRLYSFENFRKEFGSVLNVETGLTEEDAMVLLKFLERDRKVLLFDKEVIKFRIETSPKEINAVDRGILELSNAVKKLHEQVDELQHKIDQYTEKATTALRQKRKHVALVHLRSRKQLEDLLSKRLGSLGTLESTLINVEAAAGDIEIMKSYESSTATLRAILAHPSLQRESIDATMDAVAEAHAHAREVDESIRMGGDLAIGVGDVIDDSELENELRELIEEAEAEKQEISYMESAGTAKLLGEGMKVPTMVPTTVDKARVEIS